MHSKKFKYQEYTEQLFNCPPDTYKEIDTRAFRWVFPECDANSFKPVALINPTRKFDNDDEKCSGYALSMFEQEEGAYKKYKKFVSNKPDLKNTFGTQIAELQLTINLGVAEPESKGYTHFNFHEYKESDLSEKIIKIIEIFDENGDFTR